MRCFFLLFSPFRDDRAWTALSPGACADAQIGQALSDQLNLAPSVEHAQSRLTVSKRQTPSGESNALLAGRILQTLSGKSDQRRLARLRGRSVGTCVGLDAVHGAPMARIGEVP